MVRRLPDGDGASARSDSRDPCGGGARTGIRGHSARLGVALLLPKEIRSRHRFPRDDAQSNPGFTAARSCSVESSSRLDAPAEGLAEMKRIEPDLPSGGGRLRRIRGSGQRTADARRSQSTGRSADLGGSLRLALSDRARLCEAWPRWRSLALAGEGIRRPRPAHDDVDGRPAIRSRTTRASVPDAHPKDELSEEYTEPVTGVSRRRTVADVVFARRIRRARSNGS